MMATVLRPTRNRLNACATDRGSVQCITGTSVGLASQRARLTTSNSYDHRSMSTLTNGYSRRNKILVYFVPELRVSDLNLTKQKAMAALL